MPLKPLHVYQWVDSKPNWTTGKRGAIEAVQRALNWAHRAGLVETHPLRFLEKPEKGRREQVISPDDYERIRALVPDQQFRDLLDLAWETGARPAELFSVEAQFVDLDQGTWVGVSHQA